MSNRPDRMIRRKVALTRTGLDRAPLNDPIADSGRTKASSPTRVISSRDSGSVGRPKTSISIFEHLAD